VTVTSRIPSIICAYR